MSVYDVLVVGAGLAGSTVAERLASQVGANVLLIDRRPHLAGNCHDPVDADGLRYHQYGPHIFHTNATEVIDYLSGFTAWRPYEHRVLANVDGRLVPIPINRTTVNALYGLELDEPGVAAFLAARAEPRASIRTSEDVILARVGRELYERFFAGYTRKQWGRDPAELDASVCGRIPTRTGDDDRYFTDRFQAMPVDGFTAMVDRMTDHPRIDRVLGVDYRTIADRARFRHVVFTGPIDTYFDERFGRLPYRSLRFEFATYDRKQFQPAGCVNEPSLDIPFTRTTGTVPTGQTHARSSRGSMPRTASVLPDPAPEAREQYRKYAQLAERTGRRSASGGWPISLRNMDRPSHPRCGRPEELVGVVRVARRS